MTNPPVPSDIRGQIRFRVRPRTRILCIVPFLAILLLPSATLAQRNIDGNHDCDPPLLAAVHKGDASKVSQLLKDGAKVNEESCPNGETPLVVAIGNRSLDIAFALLQAGANPNFPSGSHRRPLIAAAFVCSNEIVSALLARGARANDLDSHGYSALMYAASNCDDGSIVALLIRSGVDVNLRADKGDTALTIAAFHGDEFAVKELVAAGADIKVKNDEGETALKNARDRKVGRKESHDRIFRFLSVLDNP